MQVDLRYVASAPRPGEFTVRKAGALWRVDVCVRLNESASTHHITFYGQIRGRGDARVKDPDGVPALTLSRVDGETFRLEPATLHRDLPLCVCVLHGWAPEGMP